MMHTIKVLLKSLRFIFSATLCFALVYLISIYALLQPLRGLWAYQVQDNRVKWAVVVCLPGYEEFYDYVSNTNRTRWTAIARYRVSPWFDTGEFAAPIDQSKSHISETRLRSS
jgi:hypothetical protein